MVRLDKAARVYNRIVAPLLAARDENEALTDERVAAMDSQPEAWETYVNECVMLLVPGLLETDIDLIGLDVLEGLLRDLGYFRDPEVLPEKAADKTEQPPLTGATVPDGSLTSTPDTTPINS